MRMSHNLQAAFATFLGVSLLITSITLSLVVRLPYSTDPTSSPHTPPPTTVPTQSPTSTHALYISTLSSIPIDTIHDIQLSGDGFTLVTSTGANSIHIYTAQFPDNPHQPLFSSSIPPIDLNYSNVGEIPDIPKFAISADGMTIAVGFNVTGLAPTGPFFQILYRTTPISSSWIRADRITALAGHTWIFGPIISTSGKFIAIGASNILLTLTRDDTNTWNGTIAGPRLLPFADTVNRGYQQSPNSSALSVGFSPDESLAIAAVATEGSSYAYIYNVSSVGIATAWGTRYPSFNPACNISLVKVADQARAFLSGTGCVVPTSNAFYVYVMDGIGTFAMNMADAVDAVTCNIIHGPNVDRISYTQNDGLIYAQVNAGSYWEYLHDWLYGVKWQDGTDLGIVWVNDTVPYPGKWCPLFRAASATQQQQVVVYNDTILLFHNYSAMT